MKAIIFTILTLVGLSLAWPWAKNSYPSPATRDVTLQEVYPTDFVEKHTDIPQTRVFQTEIPNEPYPTVYANNPVVQNGDQTPPPIQTKFTKGFTLDSGDKSADQTQPPIQTKFPKAFTLDPGDQHIDQTQPPIENKVIKGFTLDPGDKSADQTQPPIQTKFPKGFTIDAGDQHIDQTQPPVQTKGSEELVPTLNTRKAAKYTFVPPLSPSPRP